MERPPGPAPIRATTVRECLPAKAQNRAVNLLALGLLASAPWSIDRSDEDQRVARRCARPAFHQVMEVGDRAGHTMALSQRECVWTQPLRIEGAISKRDVLYLFTDAREDGARETGYNTVVMS